MLPMKLSERGASRATFAAATMAGIGRVSSGAGPDCDPFR